MVLTCKILLTYCFTLLSYIYKSFPLLSVKNDHTTHLSQLTGHEPPWLSSGTLHCGSSGRWLTPGCHKQHRNYSWEIRFNTCIMIRRYIPYNLCNPRTLSRCIWLQAFRIFLNLYLYSSIHCCYYCRFLSCFSFNWQESDLSCTCSLHKACPSIAAPVHNPYAGVLTWQMK